MRHVADEDVGAPERVAQVCEQVQLGLATLRREPRGDALVHLAHPCRAVRLVLRDERRQGLQHRARVAVDAEPLVGRAEVLGARIDLDQATLELERPLRRRLGAELGADGEHDVRGAQELLERPLVAGRADGERVVGRDRSLAHVGGRCGRAEPFGQRDERRRGAGAQHAAAGPQHRPLGRLEQPRGLGEQGRVGRGQRDGRDVERRAAPAGRSRPRARRRGSRARRGPTAPRSPGGTPRRSGRAPRRCRARPRATSRRTTARPTASAARAGSPGCYRSRPAAPARRC